jgi:hypothetical protein
LPHKKRCFPFPDVLFFVTLSLPQCGHFTDVDTILIPPCLYIDIYITVVSTCFQPISLTAGKTLRSTGYIIFSISGEQFGELAVQSPTTLKLTLKWAANAGKQDTRIIIERANGQYWTSTISNLCNAFSGIM